MNFTSEQKKAVPLLDKFRCDQCQKWKHNTCFSKKQLGTYAYKKASGQSVNGISARLRCRCCTGTPISEMKCQGICGMVRPLDDFSKQARSNGGSKWCKACTAWKEAQEPGVTTAPAVSTDVAPDEQDTYATTTYDEDDSGALSDPEAGAGSDEDFDYGYPGTTASELDNTSSVGALPTFTAVPHAFGALSLSGASENQTENSHLDSGPASLSGNVPTFTAYDAQGNAHTKQRVPSDTASQASNATVVPARNSNWAKPEGRRNEPKMTVPVVVPNQSRGYESDSEDEM